MNWTEQEYWEAMAADALSGWWRRLRIKSREQKRLDKLVAKGMRRTIHHRIAQAAERTDAFVWTLHTDADKAVGGETKRILEAVQDEVQRRNHEYPVLVATAPLRVELVKRQPDLVTLHEYAKAIKRLPKDKGNFVPGVRQRVTDHVLHGMSLYDPKVAHLLIGGSTGSGKTMLAITILTTLAMLNRQGKLSMLVIDPKKVDIGNTAVARLPHLSHPVITDPALAVAAVNRLATEVERREAEVDWHSAQGKRWTMPGGHILCYIDEMYELTDIDKDVMDTLVWIARKGRGLGVHLALATQRPTVDAVDGHLRANLPTRFGGWVRDASESQYVTGLPGSGLHNLQGSGMFKLYVRDQEAYIQGLYADLDDHLPALVDEIRSQWDEQPGWVISRLTREERAPESVQDAVAAQVTSDWETQALKGVIELLERGHEPSRRDVEALRRGVDQKGVNQNQATRLIERARSQMQQGVTV